jgi:hypothetical protein
MMGLSVLCLADFATCPPVHHAKVPGAKIPMNVIIRDFRPNAAKPQ